MTGRRLAASVALVVMAAWLVDGGARGPARPAAEPASGTPQRAAVASVTSPGDPAHPRTAPASAPAGEQISELEWAIPMLAHEPRTRQLETLRWLKTVPEDKVLSAFAALIDEHAIPFGERKRLALAMIDQYIDALEQDGVTAPWSDGSVAAQVVDRSR